ncbi:MAG: PPE domain-containing protein, partial [Sciscionella sp.]
MPDIRWRGQEHHTLYNWINTGPGATASTPQLDYWGGLKQSLADISNKLNSTLNDLGANWEGTAGGSATAGLTPLRQWAEEAQSSADVMASSAQDQADHIATARAAMPEPQQVPTGAPAAWQSHEAADAARHGDHGPANAIAKQAADHEQQETIAADAHERAVQVMSNYQANSENNAATLGAFGSPPDINVAVRMPDGSDSIGVGYLGGNAPMAHRAEGGQQVTPSGATDHPSGVAGTGGPSAATEGAAA